jgi:heterotetrameric sarcosine oxidase alpha subunit
MSGSRLAAGGVVDRSRPLAFTVDGRSFSGFAGDTLASALLASGTMLSGRSFKRHRPRGVLSAGPEEPNALYGVGEGGRFEPNSRATQVMLYDGLVGRSQNRWPSLESDVLGVLDRAAPLLPAGFYYKTFKTPLSAWPVYEKVIRALAGLGDPPQAPDPDAYGERFAHADMLVIGLGVAGLAAARAAAEAGLRVLAVEQDSVAGGAMLGAATRVGDVSAAAFAEGELGRLRELGVRVLVRTTAFGVYDHGLVGLVQRLAEPGQKPGGAISQRLWKVRARHVVLAAGAIERPLVFDNNDRPGVMLAHAGAVYAQRFGVAVGQHVVFVANHDHDYQAVRALLEAGIRIAAVLDQRPSADIGAATRQWAAHAVDLRSGVRLLDARGGRAIESIQFSTDAAPSVLACDALLCAGGWTPTLHLHAQARGRQAFDAARGVFLPDGAAGNLAPAGACNGAVTPQDCWREGWRAGGGAAVACGRKAPPDPAPPFEHAAEAAGAHAMPPLHADRRSKTAFVDFQNDVTLADIAIAHQEGYQSVEHLKRYTTLGMGTDQGKTSNLIGLHAMAQHRQQSPDLVGLTTYRPPYTPVTIAALAHGHTGAHLEPVRRSPVFADLAEAGAVFQTSGLWLRPHYFPARGETLAQAAMREAKAVRARVGLTDASTLGKFEVVGPDAAAFLDLIYASGVRSLKVGKARYAVMLNDDGCVFDDGTIWRVAEERYFVTASTARSAAVLQRLELFREFVAPEHRVVLHDVTEAWAAFVVAGPGSRSVVMKALPQLDELGPQDIAAHQSMRVARISYSGEHAYEIYTPPATASTCWRALLAAVREAGGAPYGLEALEWLRIEKGHVAVGAEIDGRTTAADLGLQRWVRKGVHAGSAGASRPALASPDRWRLVGLRSETAGIPEGAPLVDEAGVQVGRVTSSGFGVGVGAHIALGLVRRGAERHGEILTAASATRRRHVRVRLTEPCAYDPEGARLA